MLHVYRKSGGHFRCRPKAICYDPRAIAEEEFIGPKTKINELDGHLEPGALGDKGLDGRKLARRDHQVLGALSDGPVDALYPTKRDRRPLDYPPW